MRRDVGEHTGELFAQGGADLDQHFAAGDRLAASHHGALGTKIGHEARQLRDAAWAEADTLGPVSYQSCIHGPRISSVSRGPHRSTWPAGSGYDIAMMEQKEKVKRRLLDALGRDAGGSSGGIGTLVTKTLVISGEGGTVNLPDGQRGAMLRAYDKRTGAEVGAVAMPGAQTGSPMTYMLGGKQYIVVAASSSIRPGELVAYKLP